MHGGDSGKAAQTIRAGVIKCIQYLSAWLALQSRELVGLALQSYRHCQLAVSGPSGKRARRREAARLAQRQGGGKTQQRQDAAGCCGASASGKPLPYECWSLSGKRYAH